MKHQRYARTTPAKDDQLPAITKINQCLSCDAIIVAKDHSNTKRLGADGSAVGLTIMDQHSGCGLGFPTASATLDRYYYYLKFFVGPSWKSSPQIMVKSDADKAITGAVQQLGWHPEPSLANRFPHNPRHERWHQTLKSVQPIQNIPEYDQ